MISEGRVCRDRRAQLNLKVTHAIFNTKQSLFLRKNWAQNLLIYEKSYCTSAMFRSEFWIFKKNTQIRNSKTFIEYLFLCVLGSIKNLVVRCWR